MIRSTSDSVERLVEQFTKLPTIGRKTARRLAAYVLKMSRADVVSLAELPRTHLGKADRGQLARSIEA